MALAGIVLIVCFGSLLFAAWIVMTATINITIDRMYKAYKAIVVKQQAKVAAQYCSFCGNKFVGDKNGRCTACGGKA
jgi:uncharacterized paraquat-inducible protein A